MKKSFRSSYHFVPFYLVIVIQLFSPACSRKTESPSQQQSIGSKKKIVIAAIGDVMMPGSIQAVVRRNKYNYDLLFEKVAPDLGAADITFANLETPVDHKAKISGYPRFNAKPELLAALKRAGVDIVTIANNHVMDAGVEGLKRTLDNITTAGLLYTGAGKTKAEAGEIKYITAKDLSVAFLAYTYSTNERLPKNKESEPGVNILRPDSKADLSHATDKVRQARQSADIVVVSLHWGDEYKTLPTRWQRQVAAELIEAGADIILGHHPHVLQPIETYTAKDGRQGVIAFSLGNFISSQNYGVSFKNRNHKRARRGDGIILSLTAVKKSDRTSVTKIEFQPIWTMREKVGSSTVTRPVGLAREIGRLEALPQRSKEEENEMKLLSHRQKLIIEMFSPRPAANMP
jgi:poly-gamma-glutamate capsule biosynthesis protein CapA/YwtB (metallophosphatase superfamily)